MKHITEQRATDSDMNANIRPIEPALETDVIASSTILNFFVISIIAPYTPDPIMPPTMNRVPKRDD
eukprot:CAMPEP_0202978940 /NCGR_PEP_ID=MMETSP1396-20130829/85221_1 /ASSEMBLY_ACC=CAM_ASM_000872 /TAXON_ID= /ORGANISM="Pseudokeronopsis sp., Strain Brazil" /LENGTH=65 /DNA_ID=CAMNT_0049718127 /DNA_START=327 /DNA_END=524 /DNA_ORIENTATION=+